MMKILADTNILFSALLWPKSKPAAALLHAARHSDLVLCDSNIAELHRIIADKAPHAMPDLDVFLAELSYELVPAVESAQKLIRDPKDAPILNAAILADVDIVISGDRHFLELELDRPRTMTAAQYLEEFAEL